MTATVPKQTPKSDYQRVLGLMKKMGSKTGFDPIPPDQHSWTMAPGQPPLYRIWGWMCAHTIHWGHRSPFAISSDGDELHVEHIAADLEMDEANVYHYWREGMRLGLWHNGDKAEGKRKLFLCGEVRQQPDSEGGEPDLKTVCTNSFSGDQLNEYNRLASAVKKQVSDWAPERLEQFLDSRVLHTRVREVALAEVVAAGRLILDQVEDSEYQAWGLVKNRQEHTSKLAPEELAERQARIPQILPVVKLYVQTVSASVQSRESTSYTNGNGHVQNVSGDPYLIEKSHPEKTENQASSSVLNASHGQAPDPHCDGEKSVNELYTRGKPEAAKKTAHASLKPTPKQKLKPAKETEGEALKIAKELELDLSAARQMLEGARGADPNITPREVIELAHAKLYQWRHQIRDGKIDNIPGRLMKAVPEAAVGGLRDRVKENARRQIEKDLQYARLVVTEPEGEASEKDRERSRVTIVQLEAELEAMGFAPERAEGAAS